MTRGTLQPNLDSSGTTRNTTSSSYPEISLTCTHRITNPSRLVHFLPNPTRFNGWLTKSTSGRTGNPHCYMPPATSSGSQLYPVMWTLTSGHWFVILGMGSLFSPAPLAFNFSRCHLLKASWCGQFLAKWPGDPHTKYFRSSL